MAEKRMFSKSIIDSDAFLDLPMTTRLLYYDLSMRADDDGFVNSPKKIMRMIGASQDDLSLLLLKKFVIGFENGVVVIKHWRIHNYIRKDTYCPTNYIDQKELLELDENKAYKLKSECRPRAVHEPSTQNRLDKNRLEENSIGEDKEEKIPPTAYGKFNNVLLSDTEYENLKKDYPNYYESYIDKFSCYIEGTGKVYKKPYAIIVKWLDEDKRKDCLSESSSYAGYDLELYEKMLEES